MSKKISIIFLSLFLFSFFFIPIHANAEPSILFGKLPDCFTTGETCTICEAIGMIIYFAGVILKFVGILALLLFIWGGFSLIISAGNEEAIKKGKGILVGTIIGVLIVFGGWQIVWMTIATLMPTTTTDNKQTLNGLSIFGNDWTTGMCKTVGLNSVEKNGECTPLSGTDSQCKQYPICQCIDSKCQCKTTTPVVSTPATTTTPPVTAKKAWHASCVFSKNECETDLSCQKRSSGTSFICAKNGTIQSGGLCYSLETGSECVSGFCDYAVSTNSYKCR